MRKLINGIALFFIRGLGRILYDSRFLKGRWFEQSNLGWRWVLQGFFYQWILGFNRNIPWPISPQSKVSNPKNIEFHPDNLDNFQSFGCYFQNYNAKITIGRGVYIAPNVGIITANHDPHDLDKSLPGKDVHIGEDCWLGMGAIVLPGVTLGPRTIVGAGSVVTKSFPEGKCVLGGVPAKVLKSL